MRDDRVKPTAKRKAPRNARTRAARLTEQHILDAALEVIQANGVEALGMRSLAKKLGVTAMAIYYYVPSKAALIERLAESMLATVPTPAPSNDAWDAQLRAYALAIWERMSAHPGLSRIVLERPPLKASGRLNLYVLSVLRSAGFDPRSALQATLCFHTYLAGAVSAQVRGSRPGRRRPRSGVQARRAKLPPEAQQFVELLAQVDARGLLEFGLDVVIGGLRVERERRVASGTTGATVTQRASRTRAVTDARN